MLVCGFAGSLQTEHMIVEMPFTFGLVVLVTRIYFRGRNRLAPASRRRPAF